MHYVWDRGVDADFGQHASTTTKDIFAGGSIGFLMKVLKLPLWV